MIQPATASRSPSPPDRSTDGRRAGAAAGFQQSLAAFLDAREPKDPSPTPADPGNDDPATDGKGLPGDTAATLAWLPQLPPPATDQLPVAIPPALPQPVGTALPVAVQPAPPQVILATIDGLPTDAAVKTAMAANAKDAEAVADAASPTDPQADAFALPAVPAAAPGSTAPAAEVFGAAIRAAAGQDDEASPRRDSADSGPLPVGAVEMAPQRHAVLATGDVQQAPLDTRQGNFPHQMIDRIEQLRDDANANDTRIRLIPDALGMIDVTMRREGSAVHVHFAAEQSATRALLEDARPQLADIAAARGLALGQTSVGSDGGAQQRPQQSPNWRPPHVANPTAPTAAAATPDDIRIA